MGVEKNPEPAQVILGIIHGDADARAACLQKLQERLGEVRLLGGEMAFDWTAYYQEEMGPDLRRCFATGTKLVPRDQLSDLKRWTNHLEKDFTRPNGTRRINLDPGLLSAENFVLATTKKGGHRVYLRDGIYAEVAMQYVRGRFEVFDWTYPDYRSETVRSLFAEVRRAYLRTLRMGRDQEENP